MPYVYIHAFSLSKIDVIFILEIKLVRYGNKLDAEVKEGDESNKDES